VSKLTVNKALLHCAFWVLAYFFWVYIFRNSTLVLTRTITIQFCYLVFIAINYYFDELYAIPYLLNKKKYFPFFLAFIGMIAATAWLRVPVSYLVRKHVFELPNVRFDALNVFSESFINIFFWVFFIVAAKMVIDRIRSQVYIEQIEKEKAANELNFLRAQFNPHFLFNSINSIYAHIDKSNKDARGMLLTFSEMLRYQLYECNVELIDIERELNYIRNYITLQKSRIDERIRVCLSADNIDRSISVPPLILITFIENAFKYVGFNECRENKIELRLEAQSGNLLFTICNTKDGFISKTQDSSGLGIANTKRRLELLYPGKHKLDIVETETDYTVHLTIDSI